MEEKEKLILTTKEASELSGVPVSTLRELLTRGLVNIGVIYPPKYKGGNKTYRFFKYKLLRELGLINDILENETNEEVKEEDKKEE